MRINDVLRSKEARPVVTIAPEATVQELLALLAQHNVGAVVVSPDGQSVAGIVSERDVVRRMAQGIEALLEQPVADLMTTEVHTCTGEEDLDALMSTMTTHRIRHVPVVVDSGLTGIVSIGDVVKSRIGELEFERDQLDHYLQSG